MSELMTTQNTSIRKLYVLDSSVLIHDPEAIWRFEEHKVAIPSIVLNELDKIKSESSARGHYARQAQRNLVKAIGSNGKTNKLHNGGEITLLLPPPQILSEGENHVKTVLGSMSPSDHKIISTAYWSQSTLPNENCQQVVLVTKDMGMSLKARACDLIVEDYRHDKAPLGTNGDQNPTTIEIDNQEAQSFMAQGFIELTDSKVSELEHNCYGLFSSSKKIPWRYVGNGKFVQVHGTQGIKIRKGAHIKPRNLEQLFLIDALLNPEIDLVTVKGVAGTGKTLLTMAASLQLIESGSYNGICISKPNESVGRENGFLPGTLEEKMRPWLQPYADAINHLHEDENFTNKKQSQRKQKTTAQPLLKPYDKLTQQGIVEITAIEYIRGRSIPNRLFVLDEVQNVSPSIIKTIASRMAEGSKLVCLGDLEQIDNPYLDKESNGLAHIRANMRNLPNAAHISLCKGERSLLAQQAANLL